MVTVLDIHKATTADVDGIKVMHSPTHIGLFSYSLNKKSRLRLRLFKKIVVARHLFRKTRLLLVSVGKFTLKLYNYPIRQGFHRSDLVYNLRILCLSLNWNRF